MGRKLDRDLVDRTYRFARDVRRFLNTLPRVLSNYEDARQLVRSSGSVAANYIEAQEAFSRKDFFFRIKLCRKEARESGLWLSLLELSTDEACHDEQTRLIGEADELKRIFSSIAGKEDGKVAASAGSPLVT